MKVKLSARARLAARRIDDFWRKDRPDAPDNFVDELEEILDLLGSSPEMGKIHGGHKGQTLYRVLLSKTKYNLYYVIGKTRIEVVTVWGGKRQRQPRFDTD